MSRRSNRNSAPPGTVPFPGSGFLSVLLLAACASAPVPREPPADQPPLPRSSIVAVLAHRGELELSEEQANLLEQADAELQVRLTRLRAEGGVPAQAAGGLSGSLHGGPQPSDPRAGGYGSPGGAPVTGLPGAGAPSGGRPGGFGMNMGPGGFQASPTGGGMPGGSGQGGAGPAAGAPTGAARRDPVKAQEALDASLDDADTRAFLKAEAALTPAQRERARDIASRYREQLFERREQQRGR